METGNITTTDFKGEKTPETNIDQAMFQQPSNKRSMPMIAGILLIISGVIALLFWIQVIIIDVSTLESVIDISQFQELDPTITPERIKGFLTTCGTIFCILAIFPILGGILALKRKLWGITLVGGIIGLFTIGFFISSVLSLIAIIMLVISRKEFQ